LQTVEQIMMRASVTLALALAAAPAVLGAAPAGTPGVALFSDLAYVERSRPSAGAVTPVLPGFYPDPSVVKVGRDYYLVNSTFAFFPGIPVFHSRDLVNWRQIGNAINDPTTLELKGMQSSRGVYAPDISYHDGTFYILNTCRECGGNFVITAKDPAGPWTRPVWLNFEGIDPAMFFEGGKAYIVSNGLPPYKQRYTSHRALYLQEFDLAKLALVGPRRVLNDGGTNLAGQSEFIEGPHIYKRNSWYYLIGAEGGTRFNHSEVAFRSRELWGPYAAFPGNPILTQRDLPEGRADPVTSTGHAALVEGPDGGTWALFLGTRPYRGDFYNTGRETFLTKVDWSGEWPIIQPHATPLPQHFGDPAYAASVTRRPRPSPFSAEGRLGWMGLRMPEQSFHRWTGQRSIAITPSDARIGDIGRSPSFLAWRQAATDVTFRTSVHFTPRRDGDAAGIVALQKDDFYVFCGVRRENGADRIVLAVRDSKARGDQEVTLGRLPARHGATQKLALHTDANTIRCTADGRPVPGAVPSETLSSTYAWSFVGTMIGVYAHRS